MKPVEVEKIHGLQYAKAKVHEDCPIHTTIATDVQFCKLW
jgi:hypothetical protein